MKELKKDGRGGARPGAGMPKGYKTQKTITKEQAREALRSMVIAELKPMTEAQIKASQGINHFVLRTKTGKFERVIDIDQIVAAMNDPEAIWEIWSRDPSIQAFTDLMNRALDKPSEHVALTGGDGKPLEIIIKKPW